MKDRQPLKAWILSSLHPAIYTHTKPNGHGGVTPCLTRFASPTHPFTVPGVYKLSKPTGLLNQSNSNNYL